MINFYIDGQKLSVYGQPFMAGDTIDYLEAAFVFSSDWDGLTKTAHFKLGNTSYDIILTDDRIRKEDHLNLAAGVWQVWVHGDRVESSNVTQRITTDIAEVRVAETGVSDGEPMPITPASLGEQILATAQNAEDIAQSVRDDADAGKFNGAPGPAGGVDIAAPYSGETIVSGSLFRIRYGNDYGLYFTNNKNKQYTVSDKLIGTWKELGRISESGDVSGLSVAFTAATTKAPIKSGESFATLMGKILAYMNAFDKGGGSLDPRLNPIGELTIPAGELSVSAPIPINVVTVVENAECVNENNESEPVLIDKAIKPVEESSTPILEVTYSIAKPVDFDIYIMAYALLV